MNRRIALHSFLLLLLFASVACSTKPAGENTEASATSSTSDSKQVALPAGTVVTVRLSSAVGSKISAKGDHFSAIVATPVELDGKVVLPAGAEALGKVVEAVPQGRFKGAAVLRLVLESVSVDGDSYDVQTSSVSRTRRARANVLRPSSAAAPGAERSSAVLPVAAKAPSSAQHWVQVREPRERPTPGRRRLSCPPSRHSASNSPNPSPSRCSNCSHESPTSTKSRPTGRLFHPKIQTTLSTHCTFVTLRIQLVYVD